MASNLVRVDHASPKVLNQVQVFCQAPVLVMDNKWSNNPPTISKDYYPLSVLNQYRCVILLPCRISITMMLGYLSDYWAIKGCLAAIGASFNDMHEYRTNFGATRITEKLT